MLFTEFGSDNKRLQHNLMYHTTIFLLFMDLKSDLYRKCAIIENKLMCESQHLHYVGFIQIYSSYA